MRIPPVTLRLLPPGDDPLTRLRKARTTDKALERRYVDQTQHWTALLDSLRVQILEIQTQQDPRNTILQGRLAQARTRADASVGLIPSEAPPGSGRQGGGLVGAATRGLKREIDEARLSLARLRGARFP